MESSQEAQAQALQELSAKLQQEYAEKLQVEHEKHREEIEKLQVCTVYSANSLRGKLEVTEYHTKLLKSCKKIKIKK